MSREEAPPSGKGGALPGLLVIVALGAALGMVYGFALSTVSPTILTVGAAYGCAGVFVVSLFMGSLMANSRRRSSSVAILIASLDVTSLFGGLGLALLFVVIPLLNPAATAFSPVFYNFAFVWVLIIALRVGAQFTLLKGEPAKPLPRIEASVPLQALRENISQVGLTMPGNAEDPESLRQILLLFRVSDMVNELKAFRQELNSRGFSTPAVVASDKARYSVTHSTYQEETPEGSVVTVVAPKVEAIPRRKTNGVPDAAENNPWAAVLAKRQNRPEG